MHPAKFFSLSLSVLGLCLATSGCKPAAPTPDAVSAAPGGLPDLGGRRVVVAVENAYEPFNFIRVGNRQAVGWDYDVIAELGRRLHFKPEFREIAWEAMIQAVSTGQFDMAGDGITITPERARVVDFSTGYLTVHQRLLVRRDEARFGSMEAFATMHATKLGAQKGSTNYTKAEALVGAARVVAFDGFGDLVQGLLTGDLDAVIIDDTAGQGYVGEHREKLRLLAGTLPGEELGFVFTKGSPLRAPVDAALAAMKADGSLAKINARWFAVEATPEAPAAAAPATTP